jgi:hypothetical protein
VIIEWPALKAFSPSCHLMCCLQPVPIYSSVPGGSGLNLTILYVQGVESLALKTIGKQHFHFLAFLKIFTWCGALHKS